MENIEENIIYFIYCQNGKISNIERIEQNNIIKEVIPSKQEIKGKDLYILFKIKLPDDFKNKPFALTLVDKKGDLYYKNIFSKDIEKFKYNIIFESYYDKINNLNQKVLSFKEQFFIFKNSLDKDINLLNDLYLNTINYLSKDKFENIDHSFIISLFLEIYKINKNEQNNKFKLALKNYFSKLNLKILEIGDSNNSENSENPSLGNLDINTKDLEIISDLDTYKLRNELISITGNIEEINEKIDVFLGLYYIHYKPKLFISLLDIKKDKFEEIKNHLINNKKLFNNFKVNEKIIKIINESDSLDQIIMLINNFISDMEETMKLISNFDIFFKFLGFLENGSKMVSILQLASPKKTDNIEEIYKSFQIVMELFKNMGRLPFRFQNDFYIEYCKIFMNEDLEKIKTLHDILKLYNKFVIEKSR